MPLGQAFSIIRRPSCSSISAPLPEPHPNPIQSATSPWKNDEASQLRRQFAPTLSEKLCFTPNSREAKTLAFVSEIPGKRYFPRVRFPLFVYVYMVTDRGIRLSIHLADTHRKKEPRARLEAI